MSLWNKYPYSSMHELNLDWILKLMQELHADWDEFTALNKITNAGAWDITKQYQAWTVVSDNNVGYISLKPVPAGVAISNTEYWGLIADYNILITNLSNRISTLESQMADLTRPRRFIMVGDSYDTVTGDSWAGMVSTILGLSDTVKCTQGGYGFLPAAKKWLDLVTATTITGGDDTITDILIAGGANDAFLTIAQIPSAMIDFDTYVRGRFTNLKNIYVGFLGNSFYDSTQSNNMKRASFKYIDTAKILGWKYLNNVESTLLDPYLMQIIDGYDYIHPNVNGVHKLAYNIAEAVLTGSCETFMQEFPTTFNKNNTLFESGTFDINEYINGHILTIDFAAITLKATASASGTFVIGSCTELTNAIPIGTAFNVNLFLIDANVYKPGLLQVTANNELTLVMPPNTTVGVGQYLRILPDRLSLDVTIA